MEKLKYLGSIMMEDLNTTMEITTRIVIGKEAFNNKTSLLCGKLLKFVEEFGKMFCIECYAECYEEM